MDALQKRNNTIDLLRFFTCPFILLIHCPLPAPLGDVLIHIGRYGVPFFLLVSGWFSYVPDTQGMVRHARKKLVDTFKLMGSFAVVYLILNSTSAVLRGDGLLSWMQSYTNLASAAYLILFNRALFWGSTGYYVFMLVYVYVLLLIIIRFNLLNKAFFLVPILLSANVLCGAFTDLPWFYYGNFLFTGLPFFLLGHWLHRHHNKLPRKASYWIYWFAAGVLLSLAEAYLNKAAYCYCGSILMAVALLMIAVNHNIKMLNPVIVQAFSRYSVYIFVAHCGIRDVILSFIERQQLVCSEYEIFCLIVVFSLLFGFVWDFLSMHRKTRYKANDK